MTRLILIKKSSSCWLGIILLVFQGSEVLAQSEGEWTGRGWQGPSPSVDGEMFKLIALVAVVAGIGYFIHERFPDFFPTILGLLILFIVARFVVAILELLDVGINRGDVFWVFFILLGALYISQIFSKKNRK